MESLRQVTRCVGRSRLRFLKPTRGAAQSVSPALKWPADSVRPMAHSTGLRPHLVRRLPSLEGFVDAPFRFFSRRALCKLYACIKYRFGSMCVFPRPEIFAAFNNLIHHAGLISDNPAIMARRKVICITGPHFYF